MIFTSETIKWRHFYNSVDRMYMKIVNRSNQAFVKVLKLTEEGSNRPENITLLPGEGCVVYFENFAIRTQYIGTKFEITQLADLEDVK